ncbi:2-oxoglutarate dehydrogenase complex E2 component, partial [Gamsiella multidivaricata]
MTISTLRPKQLARAARPLAALSRTSTLLASPAVQVTRRQLSINAAPAITVTSQRFCSPYRGQVRSYGTLLERKLIGNHLTFANPEKVTRASTLTDYVVKVPHMAESISEGSLKQWNKKVGDFVNVDEEVASIETDK